MELIFEWDKRKEKSNITKHSVSFEIAATVFGDDLSITIADPLHSENEERYVIMGESIDRRLLVVVFTERNNRIRIISAREATNKERSYYESE